MRIEDFPSIHVEPRNVDIWLPPEYENEPDRRFPVLYMHDGQNCFAAEDSAFGVAWEVQRALQKLVAAGEARPAIIVGIWNVEQRRWLEYRPARPFDALSERARSRVTAGLGGMPESDAYLSFVVEEVKPHIDAKYRTLLGREHTLMMGASMGGLISLYAICEYPDVFGAAACVSTHWPAVEGVITPYLQQRLPDPNTHRIYFDYGTETLDSLYGPLQQVVDEVMAVAGYRQVDNWVTRKFPGAGHFESFWQARVHIPLRFLLGY